MIFPLSTFFSLGFLLCPSCAFLSYVFFFFLILSGTYSRNIPLYPFPLLRDGNRFQFAYIYKAIIKPISGQTRRTLIQSSTVPCSLYRIHSSRFDWKPLVSIKFFNIQFSCSINSRTCSSLSGLLCPLSSWLPQSKHLVNYYPFKIGSSENPSCACGHQI